MFSANEKEVVEEEIFNVEGENVLNDIPVSRKDIREAIDEISAASAAGPDGIPTVFLKNMRDKIGRSIDLLLIQRVELLEPNLVETLKVIDASYRLLSNATNGLLRQSIAESSIVKVHKIAYIAQQHKGRSRLHLKSQTSHIIKTFERVIKKLPNHLQ